MPTASREDSPPPPNVLVLGNGSPELPSLEAGGWGQRGGTMGGGEFIRGGARDWGASVATVL